MNFISNGHIHIHAWTFRTEFTKSDLANLTTPFKLDLWNYTWTLKEQLWCGFYN